MPIKWIPLNQGGYPAWRPFPFVPGYDILRPLGGGVLTQVFAARRRSDDTSCAIKLPRGEWADHADAHRMLPS